MLSLTILSCREQKLKCYSGFLDSRKAFDTVWHSGLFVKLHKLGIVGNIWWVLYYWYNHISSSVKWNNTLSTPFPISHGVRQGALLSPLFYAIFINDFLHQLESCGSGIMIGPSICGCPTYADDMCLLASSPSGLLVLLDTAHKYAACWRYSFNSSKYHVMVFGEYSRSWRRLRDNRSWYLGYSPILEKDSVTHLSIVLSVSPSIIDHSSKCITSAFYSLQGVGS